MTLEEILALPAGRELDCIVGERVMRWHPQYVPEGSLVHDPNYWGSFDYWRDEHGVSWPAGWSPSTDIADAWQVVEKMNHGYSFALYDVCGISSYPHGPNAVFRASVFPPQIPFDPNDPEYFWAKGDTFPHAICRAAIKATWKEQTP